jgi:dipeptidyl aminopeptidase/acylaminoacyl peptidase
MTQESNARIFFALVGLLCILTDTGSAQVDRRPIELEDIVQTREVAEQQLAPDGLTVAFVVRQARLASNDYHDILYTVDATGGPLRRLTEGESIASIRWTPDGTAITYLGSRHGAPRLLRIPRRGGAATDPYPKLLLPAMYEWSPDGERIAFVPVDRPDSAVERRVRTEGLIYTGHLTYKNLVDPRWIQNQPSRLVVYTLRTGQLDTVWTAPNIDMTLLGFQWAPDGRRIALTHDASDRPEDTLNADLSVVTLETKSVQRIIGWVGVETNPVWSPDGRSLAFQSQGDQPVRVGTLHDNSLFVLRLDGRATRQLGPMSLLNEARILGWTAGGDSLLIERNDRSARAVQAISVRGGSPRTIPETSDHLSACTKAQSRPVMSCIRQNLTMAPEVALIDLSTGKVQTLTHLNPQYDSIALGQATEIQWTNRYGIPTNGFLVLPVNYRRGVRYPFLLIYYGFEKKFSVQAQWIPSFPVQAFARDSFVVLMMNYPPMPTYRIDGPGGQGTFAEVDNPLASIDQAVDTLVAMGLADSAKGGLLGWSMGSYWTDLAICSSRRFKAASSGETGLRSPGTYWLYHDRWRYYQRGVMGTPRGEGYFNYVRTSPSQMQPPQDAPILKEYESRALHGLEYTHWWEQGAQMELVFYPDEEHMFVQPVHRLVSMRRNLDWFNFWLRNVERAGAGHEEQYARWRAMRDTITTRRSSGATRLSSGSP